MPQMILPTSPDGAPDSYVAALLRQAAPDVTQRLESIGEFVIDEENLHAMRGRRLRDPGVPSGVVEHLDTVVSGADGAPAVPVRLHRQRGVAELRPGLISIHGGGFVIGDHLGDDGRFDQWSTRLRCVGISVGYRLAPETPFPGPLEDCYAVLRWAYERSEELGIDRDRIGIIGGSAGGGLAAGLALLARDRAEIPVAFQALSYPMLDHRQATESWRAGAPVWGAATNRFGWRAYLRGRDQNRIPGHASPARADDLSGLPAAFVGVGNLDGLLDEDVEYARRLIRAGVPTDLHVFADGPHAFDSLMPDTSIAQRARRVLEDWLASRLHPAS